MTVSHLLTTVVTNIRINQQETEREEAGSRLGKESEISLGLSDLFLLIKIVFFFKRIIQATCNKEACLNFSNHLKFSRDFHISMEGVVKFHICFRFFS
jgi:hypothetical protein